MTVARLYIMHAREGEDAALESALSYLASGVRTVKGCEGVELLRDTGNERRFIFIEKWVSEEAHGSSLSSLPEGVLEPVMAALDGPPDGSYFDYLKVV
ncbi:MAG TPA: antibiotic biosynthesis monooxygenase family protein [Rhizorhapis sp.]|uniref:putative quinol monooxygenase n=1 Tax=Rhizorhapis sp. TaxID=1968842 RepID=UPI002B465D99|nr:antibiotic biosynthesis monooxygenase family protein [Rhizorhapis sp.]HKR18362.1 antibiotic biosynthesis monooxygenase family protein [Rhizorhapis sp.]HKX22663.1 antibiotic biosynthesis monooxygenase family protein [Rhizorhapis sp.]